MESLLNGDNGRRGDPACVGRVPTAGASERNTRALRDAFRLRNCLRLFRGLAGPSVETGNMAVGAEDADEPLDDWARHNHLSAALDRMLPLQGQ